MTNPPTDSSGNPQSFASSVPLPPAGPTPEGAPPPAGANPLRSQDGGPHPVEPSGPPAASIHEREAYTELDGIPFVMDVPVELRVEIGRRRTRIAELLRLAPGSVLELDTPAGDMLSIYVNQRLIARGEAVMVGDRYGVRILELVTTNKDKGANR